MAETAKAISSLEDKIRLAQSLLEGARQINTLVDAFDEEPTEIHLSYRHHTIAIKPKNAVGGFIECRVTKEVFDELASSMKRELLSIGNSLLKTIEDMKLVPESAEQDSVA